MICCDELYDAIAEDDLETDIVRNGLSVTRGGPLIRYCPWCGKRIRIDGEVPA